VPLAFSGTARSAAAFFAAMARMAQVARATHGEA
jgi:hypothetical protein